MKMMTPYEYEDALLFRGRLREQPKWHHVISGLQTAEPQKYVTRIFEPQTKTNGPWSGPKKKPLSTDVWDGY